MEIYKKTWIFSGRQKLQLEEGGDVGAYITKHIIGIQNFQQKLENQNN